MKRFNKEFISFLVGCVIFMLAIMLVGHLLYYPEDSYMLGYIKKHERAEKIEGEKILLVGGSSLAFGINSEILSEELKTPVVNMGHISGQGIDYRLNEIYPFVKKGDTVILSIEYDILNGETDPIVVWDTFEANPHSLKHFGLSTYKVFFDEAILHGLNATFNRMIYELSGGQVHDSLYVVDSFNDLGDFTAHYDTTIERKPFVSNMCVFRKKEMDYSIKRLRNFHEYCRSNGAKVYMIMPRIPTPSYELSKDGLGRIIKAISSITEVGILNKIEEIPLADSYFYDSHYHLNLSGVRINTADFVNWIKPVLEPVSH